ncbi:MAG: carboxypeptidase-like regulatory domain-containing protein [Tannerella sp.]|jgi:hypothetical protein|nr:carboxypeptidase-like regulatory domain-containing protein [Tannerella sp.]
MMRRSGKTFPFPGIAACLLLLTVSLQADDGNGVFDRIVQITDRKGTVYELLKSLSARSGYLFVYDSRVIDNNKKVKVPPGAYTLRHAICLITGNRRLRMDLLGEHILLRLPEDQPPDAPPDGGAPPRRKKEPFFTVTGALTDRETGKPLPSVSVGVANTSIGTVSNRDGAFRLTLPDSLRHQAVRFSHIGYESADLELALLPEDGGRIDFALKPQAVPLAEVVVEYAHPVQLLREMLSRRPANYSSVPVHLTSFYREGIEHRRRNIDLTESVLRVYKTGYDMNAANDQAKLVKMRRFVNRQQTDTVFPRMRSGIRSCLVLDIMKELPDFIDPGSESSYTYSLRGVDAIDGRTVNIIRFRQRKQVREPLYEGELYIEKESKALVEIRFEINPLLAGKATNMFVDKKSAGLKIDLQHARYTVSYKPAADGIYHINHVRGDIGFRIRRRKRLFSSPLTFRFEMVTCKVETAGVQPFPRNERLSPTRIFAETGHSYDRDFWENFNILLPEEELEEEIIRHLSEIIITE